MHRFGIVPGCGHNASCIFTSGIALAHVFRHPSSDEARPRRPRAAPSRAAPPRAAPPRTAL